MHAEKGKYAAQGMHMKKIVHFAEQEGRLANTFCLLM
jgi:hypothetical protein